MPPLPSLTIASEMMTMTAPMSGPSLTGDQRPSVVEPMPPEVLEALRGSINKWTAIVGGTGEDHGTENCPLCQLFTEHDCGACPVKARTGKPYCDGSPYEVYAHHKAAGKTKENAQAELDFLKSLLPESAS